MEGTKSSYLSTAPWSGFYNIEEWNPNGPKEILVKDITLSASQKEMNVGDASSLTVTITPEDATNMTLKWSSSNSSVVSVDSKGNLYALSEGTALISVSSTDGSDVTAMCIVKVVAPNAIGGITDNTMQSVLYYDMNGRRMLSPRKGINIMKSTDGKMHKVVIR